jgi:protein ImuB
MLVVNGLRLQPRLRLDMSNRVLCIWLPNWPSQRVAAAMLQADQPTPPSPIGPIILHARDARRGRLVAAANATARASGVLPHMPLSQAAMLCVDAKLVEHDPQADIEALCSLAESAQCFSPISGIEQIDEQPWAGRSLHQPQSIFLDVTGISPLFGGEHPLAKAVHHWMTTQGYLAGISIANSVGEAWALANYRYRPQIASDLKSIEQSGKIALAREAIAILAAEESIGATLFSMPIESLRLDQATVTKLVRLGIRRIGQLVELPRAGLASRFSPRLLERIDQSLNNRSEPIVCLHASPELAIEETLEHPTPDRHTINEILKVQLHRMVRVLNEMGHGVVRLVCRIEMERNSLPLDSELETGSTTPARVVRVFQIGLYQPSNETDHLLWLLSAQLDTQFSHNASSIMVGNYWARSIRVQATLTAPITWQQGELFDRHSALHRDAIAKLIDNLSSRMGRTAVVAPSIHRDPQPELAYSWRPLTGWRKDGAIQETKRKLTKAPKRNFAEQRGMEPHIQEQWRRPIRLIQPPRRIEIESSNPSGSPDQILHQGTQWTISKAVGPERIDSGWWQGSTQQRDYFRIELSNGTWLWVFRDRREKCWFLHGEFD